MGGCERRRANVSAAPDYRLGVSDSSCLLKRLSIRAFDGIDRWGIDLFFFSFCFSLTFFFDDGGHKKSNGTETIERRDNNEQMDKVKVAGTLSSPLFLSSLLSSARLSPTSTSQTAAKKTIPRTQIHSSNKQ